MELNQHLWLFLDCTSANKDTVTATRLSFCEQGDGTKTGPMHFSKAWSVKLNLGRAANVAGLRVLVSRSEIKKEPQILIAYTRLFNPTYLAVPLEMSLC